MPLNVGKDGVGRYNYERDGAEGRLSLSVRRQLDFAATDDIALAPLLARIEATERRQLKQEDAQARNEERFKLILDAMQDKKFPPQKVFFDGQIYDAFEQASYLPRQEVLRLLTPRQVQHPRHPRQGVIRPAHHRAASPLMA